MLYCKGKELEWIMSDAATGGVLWEKVFIEISQNC